MPITRAQNSIYLIKKVVIEIKTIFVFWKRNFKICFHCIRLFKLMVLSEIFWES